MASRTTESQTETNPCGRSRPTPPPSSAGELYCQAFRATYGLETVRLRFFNIFGPRQRADSPYSGVIAMFTAALTAGRTPTIFGDGLQTRDFTYVTDVVQALMLAAENPACPAGLQRRHRPEPACSICWRG